MALEAEDVEAPVEEPEPPVIAKPAEAEDNPIEKKAVVENTELPLPQPEGSDEVSKVDPVTVNKTENEEPEETVGEVAALTSEGPFSGATDPPVVKKKNRKKDWVAMTLGRPSLRPRKVEVPPTEAPPAKKVKKGSVKGVVKEKTPPTVEPVVDSMLPPELPLADSPPAVLPEENVPTEMPLLHSETSSNSSEAQLEASGVPRRRKKTRLSKKKKRQLQREPSKERTVPSPSLAECNVNPACPESSATASEAAKPPLCLCEKKPQVYVSCNNNPGDLTCQALDSLDGRVIGCCNPLPSTRVGLHRPSSRTPYIMLCSVHRQRLLRHNCCPGCGFFCTQGKFLACSGVHQYHKQCARLDGCLHCGDLTPAKTIVIALKSRRDPVFLSKPRPCRVSKPAKMSVVHIPRPEVDEPFPIVLPPEVERWTPPTDPPDPDKLANLLSVACSALSAAPRPSSASTHRYSHKSLLNAVRSGDALKLLKMMSAGLNPNHVFADLKQQTPLHMAASLGHIALVHLLLQVGLPIDLPDADHNSALCLAVLAGHLDIVKYLVKAGASLILKGDDGMTPLHLAAKNGNAEACLLLLSAPRLPRRYVDSLDDGGWTPLVWGSEFNHIEVVRLLLNEGGDPLIRDVEQNIALHWAAYGGCVDVVDLLLSSGCDLAAVNVQGDTPLHIAARQSKLDCVELLITRGAYSDIKNSLGELPRDCCPVGSPIRRSIELNEEFNQMRSRFRVRGPRILCNDISRGKERNPVQCVNAVDEETQPRDFVYVTESCFTSRIAIDRTITAMQSCQCEDNCTSGGCTCTSTSLRAWYDCDGKLSSEFTFSDPPMIFECNQVCGCNKIFCQNRVVQNGVTCRFQLFRTATRGWGIKTLNFIPKSTYVCEYIGEIITDSEADHREDDSYLFDLDNRDGETYCIDAGKYGNAARFINHMCAPNLIPVKVFVEHQDLRFPRIAFFANQDILADTEIGYNYGEKFWVIKSKTFTCTCGSDKCMYSEETIETTLETYQRKLLDLERLEALHT